MFLSHRVRAQITTEKSEIFAHQVQIANGSYISSTLSLVYYTHFVCVFYAICNNHQDSCQGTVSLGHARVCSVDFRTHARPRETILKGSRLKHEELSGLHSLHGYLIISYVHVFYSVPPVRFKDLLISLGFRFSRSLLPVPGLQQPLLSSLARSIIHGHCALYHCNRAGAPAPNPPPLPRIGSSRSSDGS